MRGADGRAPSGHNTTQSDPIMRPKGKLFALFAVFAAIGLVTATGAFTTVSAERTAEVNVAGDGKALLEIEPNTSTSGTAVDGGQYADTSSSTIVIDFDGTDSTLGNGAKGLNANAKSTFVQLLDITNQGDQQVDVSIDVAVNTNNADASDSEISNSVLIEDTDTGTDLTSSSITLGSGKTSTLDFIIDLTDGNGGEVTSGDFTLTITISAEA